MDNPSASTFDDILILGSQARSSFASFGYSLVSGRIDLTGQIAPNQIEDLKQAYVDAFWGGKWR